MKNIKQLFVCLLAISMTISVSAHAIATDAMESAISPIVITATEFDAISAQTEHVGRIMLPHTNPEGSKRKQLRRIRSKRSQRSILYSLCPRH